MDIKYPAPVSHFLGQQYFDKQANYSRFPLYNTTSGVGDKIFVQLSDN